MVGMYSCEWLETFVGSVLPTVGARLLQPGYDAARLDTRNSRIGGPDLEDVAPCSGSSCGAGGPRCSWSVGGTWWAGLFAADSNPGRAVGRRR